VGSILRALAATWLLALVCLPVEAQNGEGEQSPQGEQAAPAAFNYRDRTGNHEIDILIAREDTADGFIVRSRMNDGDMHDVEMDASAATVRYRVRSPQRRTDYTVTRQGTVLVVQGTLRGAPVSKRITIDSRPWYQSVESSLAAFALGGGRSQPEFWIVHPWEANAYLLRAASEGDQVITVNGRSVVGLKVRIRPVGILQLFWSSLYWYRPADGWFLRYEGVRGFPGTPLTVLEYVGSH
jgi:hypothetical protein